MSKSSGGMTDCKPKWAVKQKWLKGQSKRWACCGCGLPYDSYVDVIDHEDRCKKVASDGGEAKLHDYMGSVPRKYKGAKEVHEDELERMAETHAG